MQQLYAGQQAVQHQIQQLIGQSQGSSHQSSQPPATQLLPQAPIPQQQQLMNAPQVTPHQMTPMGPQCVSTTQGQTTVPLLHTGRSLALYFPDIRPVLLLVILKHNFDPVYCKAPALGGYGQYIHIWMLRPEWLDYMENKKFGL